MSQQICLRLLQTLPQQQQKLLVQRLQELNQLQNDSISSKESILETPATSTLMPKPVS